MVSDGGTQIVSLLRQIRSMNHCINVYIRFPSNSDSVHDIDITLLKEV